MYVLFLYSIVLSLKKYISFSNPPPCWERIIMTGCTKLTFECIMFIEFHFQVDYKSSKYDEYTYENSYVLYLILDDILLYYTIPIKWFLHWLFYKSVQYYGFEIHTYVQCTYLYLFMLLCMSLFFFISRYKIYLLVIIILFIDK